MGYAALSDFVTTGRLRPNDDCDKYACRCKQKEFIASGKDTLMPWVPPEIDPTTVEITHDANDWGISCDASEEDEKDDTLASDTKMQSSPPQGVEMQYTQAEKTSAAEDEANSVKVVGDAGVGDLMAQLRAAQGKK